MKIYHSFVFLFRNRSLTTFEIHHVLDRILDDDVDLDDDVRDPDFALKEVLDDSDSDSSGGSGEDGGSSAQADDVEGEVRIYMEPPVERNDGDTDRDSGNKKYKLLPPPSQYRPRVFCKIRNYVNCINNNKRPLPRPKTTQNF